MTRTKSERVYDLLRCVRPLTLNSARVVEQQLREHDLTVGTRAVLEILCGTGPLTVPALAGVLETSRQAAQRLVDELKGRGYVEQRTNPQHRRSVLIAVTESGREAFERVHAEELRQLSHMLRGVPTEDLDVAVRVLRRLSDDVRQEGGPMRTAPDRAAVLRWSTENRLLMVDLLAGLADEQWEQPTLCEGWTVRTMAGHLRQPAHYGFVRFVLVALRHHGDVDRADGLRLVASDAAWRAGSGPEVSGPVEALATAVTGRPAALCDLTGDGVTHLADRIRR